MKEHTLALQAEMKNILVVDDDPAVAALVNIHAQEAGFGGVDAAYNAEQGLAALKTGTYKLVLLDLGLPDRSEDTVLGEYLEAAGKVPVAVVTADGRVATAVRCMKEGAFDFLDKPISTARLLPLFSHAKESTQLRNITDPDARRSRSPAFSRIVTESPLMLSLFKALERLAPSPLPVLITGESGTGKELIARALHDLSGRAGAFVPVNIAGLDGSLFSDVLFGHVKGAYTGAEGTRQGLIKRAEGGTLFMDEIGDMATEAQVKLLRFLQDAEYYPLGADKSEHAECRLVLATHVNLREAVTAGKFRADLFYRLMIHSVALPPLRERKEDIPPLADHFLREAARTLKLPDPAPLDQAYCAVLQAYDFPGNIRELSAMIYGALAASGTSKPSLPYLRDYIATHSRAAQDQDNAACSDYPYVTNGRFPPLEELENQHIREALRRTDGNQSAAALLLGVSQSTISRKLQGKSEQKS